MESPRLTETTVGVAELPKSAFTSRWNVTGVTRFVPDAGTLDTVVQYGVPATNAAIRAAERHERGHAWVIQDTVAGVGDDLGRAADALRNMEVFDGEVSAWSRSVDGDTHPYTYPEASLMLDALNTYRRNLGVPDEDWEAARAFLSEYATDEPMREFIRSEYEPLEPDPGDPLPECGGMIGDDAPDGDDRDGDDRDGDPDGSGSEHGDDQGGDGLDALWDAPHINAAIRTHRRNNPDATPERILREVGDGYRLRPDRATPLARATAATK